MVKQLFLAMLGISSTYVSAMEYEPSVASHSYSRLPESGMEESYENADPKKLYELGYYYYVSAIKKSGPTQPNIEDLKKARLLLTKAVGKDHPQAALLLGYMWETGLGGKKNIQETIKLYSKAIRQGVGEEATLRLAKLYYEAKEMNMAYKLYAPLAISGNPLAQIALGDILREGSEGKDKIDANVDDAIDWYNKAAEQGYLEGYYGIGLAYYKFRDFAQAAVYFKKVIERENAEQILGKKNWEKLRVD